MKGHLTGRSSAFSARALCRSLSPTGAPGGKEEVRGGEGALLGALFPFPLMLYSSNELCCWYCCCSSSAKPTRLGFFLPSS